jgi:hypothetical protein
MGRRHARGSQLSACAGKLRGKRARFPEPQSKPHLLHLARADRKSLLLGTALASTLVIGSLFTPSPAGRSPAFSRPRPDVHHLHQHRAAHERRQQRDCPGTTGVSSYIGLYNSGVLTAFNNGIFTQTADANSPIFIENIGASPPGTTAFLR